MKPGQQDLGDPNAFQGSSSTQNIQQSAALQQLPGPQPASQGGSLGAKRGHSNLPVWAKWVPIVGGVVGILTFLICIITNRALDEEIGGVSYPYLSETGKDPPVHAIFATGFTLTAVLIVASSWFLFVKMREVAASYPAISSHFAGTTIASLVFGILTAPFLALLAILDTDSFPDAHNYCAYLASLFYIVDVCLVTWLAHAHSKVNSDASLSALVKKCVLAAAILFFMIYLPITLPIVYVGDDCDKYDEDAEQWDYSECSTLHEFRAVFQHLFIISLIAFTATLYLDLSSPTKTDTGPVGQELPRWETSSHQVQWGGPPPQ